MADASPMVARETRLLEFASGTAQQLFTLLSRSGIGRRRRTGEADETRYLPPTPLEFDVGCCAGPQPLAGEQVTGVPVRGYRLNVVFQSRSHFRFGTHRVSEHCPFKTPAWEAP
jgi:hypothetical protein